MEEKIVFTITTGSSNCTKTESQMNKSPIQFNGLSRGMTSDIFALAKAFLAISEMTNKKLQKMCYYAKAWYLALYDRNIVDAQFQAWVHGAVQPELYFQYRRYGFGLIPKVNSTSDVPEEFLSFAKEIYESYGHLTGDELEQLNHQEEPWIKARGNCRPWENCSTIISEEDMKQFYREMMN